MVNRFDKTRGVNVGKYPFPPGDGVSVDIIRAKKI
jgi:hypothetical protein